MPTELLKTPPYAPGHWVAESLRDGVRIAASPAYTLLTGEGSVSDTEVLFKVPANTLVLGAILEITTALTATAGTIVVTLGDSDLATALFTDTDALGVALSSTGFRSEYLAKVYTAAQDIILTVANASSDTLGGALRFWLMYTTDVDKRRVS